MTESAGITSSSYSLRAGSSATGPRSTVVFSSGSIAADTGGSTVAADGVYDGEEDEAVSPERVDVRARCDAGGVARTGAGARRTTFAGREGAEIGRASCRERVEIAVGGV